MKRRFLLVVFLWLGVCFLGALPYYLSGFFPNFTNALFESVSGFTTTGATVAADVEAFPRWLLLYRAASQWLGGMGVVVLTASLIPLAGGDGFQLLKPKISDQDKEKFVLRISPAVRVCWLIYISLTILQVLLLVIFRMNWFDALTHSFSTISTGGFSIRNNGAAYYNSPAVEWVFTVFMFLAGFNFALIWMLMRGKVKNVMRNSEARAYAGIVLIASLIITAALTRQNHSLGTALRQAFFHVASLISTSGFYTADYGAWPSLAQCALFFLLFIGGCSGSVAGGPKVIRYVILIKQTWNEMKRLVQPRAVFSIQLDGKNGKKKSVYGVTGFMFLYFMTLFFASLLVSASGAGLWTSFNTALICLGNVGIGLGPGGLFPSFPDYVKWGLCFVMIAGRLELCAVFALFTSDFWRE